ncbi:MAG: hypothetical protein WDO18_20355 [Acidobacteriota bacterium]
MPEPPRKPQKSKPKRTELAEWLAAHQPAIVGAAERDAIHAALAPISRSYLRRLLRESGAPLDPLVEGVRQDSLDSLERTLLALPVNQEARNIVIESRDHTKLALKTHSEKAEMILWMTTWLENPGIFPQWLQLRRRVS